MNAAHLNVRLEGDRGELQICESAELVATRAADLFVAEAARAIADRGRFRIALSGGSTPRRAYELLASPERRDRVAWDKVDFFWGDERYLPAGDHESNYRMVHEILLRNVQVPPENIYRVQVELSPPEAAAAAYEKAILAAFGNAVDVPRLDLIFLGLGTNGHTASLFPLSSVLSETSRLVMADFVAEIKKWRITMTVPLLNRGRTVAFLAAGQDKADVLRRVLRDAYTPEIIPAQLIQPKDGHLLWIIDEAAASLVRGGVHRLR